MNRLKIAAFLLAVVLAGTTGYPHTAPVVNNGFDPTKVSKTGDEMTGPLTGTTASFSESVEANNLTMNSSQVASEAAVTQALADADASHTLDVAFTTQSVATHALLMNTHGSTQLASESRVATHELDQSTHGAAVIASASFVTDSIAALPIASLSANTFTGLQTYNAGFTATGPITFTGQAEMAGASMTQNFVLNLRWLSGDGDNEGIRISATGAVGIGVEPLAPFHVRQSGSVQGIFSGWNFLGASSVYNGAFALGENPSYQGRIHYSSNGDTALYVENSYDTDLAAIRFRLRTAATARTVLELLANGVASFSGGITFNSGSDSVASTALVTQLRSDTNASNTLALAFTTDSVSTHSLLMNTHGSTQLASESRIAAHELDQSTHGATVIASAAAVTQALADADASHTLDVAFTTQSVATHALLMNTHGSTQLASESRIAAHELDQSTHGATVIASESAVTQALADADASHTLDVAFTTQSVATHALLMNTHGSTQLASESRIATHELDQSTHGATVIASETYVQDYVASQKIASQGNVLVASTASSSIVLPLDGALTEVDSASGTAIMFEFYLMGLQSPTLSVYGARITGVAENYDNTLAILEAQTKVETGWNFSDFGSYVDDTGNTLRVIASGPAGTRWQVKETKYYEMGDE